MTLPLSILDLAPIREGGTAGESFANSVALAQLAEERGYLRVWYAEHHNIASIASSATSVLIAHVGAFTRKIRLGAGGIMLPNHPPLVIAEQFGTLEALHPGRIDLGLGRAPGSDQETAVALRRDPAGADRFPDDILELQGYLTGRSLIPGVNATPGRGSNVPLYILGSSLFGAQVAAGLGLPYAFASHFAPDSLEEAITTYRRDFRASEQLDHPYVIAGVNVIVDDSPAGAQEQLVVARRLRLAGMLGRSQGLTDQEADRLFRTPAGQHVERTLTYSAVGSPLEARAYLEEFAQMIRADELIVAHMSPAADARLRSVRLLAECMGLVPA